ncbi:interferon-induced 35 kDa protein isoform X3 [Cynoglossus semilaevis]|uniref:interferon-induced 35 kDa protein isoform X3 n=1 Tax=Cynoglossus semilaevis TaxID=244447 RepID=UPI000D62E473|nr:interferon-induced 35 kDa protein isoform X3 [Cynoglossus semilaevis]
MDSSLEMEKPQQEHNMLEEVLTSIKNIKAKYDNLIQENTELNNTKKDNEEIIQKCKKRSLKLAQTVEENQEMYKEQLDKELLKSNLLKEEELALMEEIKNVEKAFQEEKNINDHLKHQALAFSCLPEKRVVFTGKKTNNVAKEEKKFDVKPHIIYPMEEGTALITFEKEVVAGNILKLKQHQVVLEKECFITLEARAVHLLLPSLVEIDTAVCPRRILISNLPEMNTETLLDKLNIHFHSSRRGGGEVESCEFLADSGTVVLTFVNPNIAGGLIEAEYHDLKLNNNKVHRIRVTHFMNGGLSDFQKPQNTN